VQGGAGDGRTAMFIDDVTVTIKYKYKYNSYFYCALTDGALQSQSTCFTAVGGLK